MSETASRVTKGRVLLLASIFVVAAAGLGYELCAGTLSSYLLGDSITQFSVVIGLFLTAMGAGSFLSRFIKKNLLRAFIVIEIALGFCGGLLPLLLFLAFATVGSYVLLLVVASFLVGTLVGLEIPLLVRIVRAHSPLRAALGNVLSLDYLGALAASLLFPFILVPHLGLVRSGALFGLCNLAVAAIGLRFFRREIGGIRLLQGTLLAAAVSLLLVFATAAGTTSVVEDLLYDDDIIHAESTPYQRLVVTRWRDDIRLFINGNIQFSSVDEFRYHEALVHPAMGLTAAPKRVLLLGGGDGLAAREILKHKSVTRVDIIDLDPRVPALAKKIPMLARLGNHSLSDRRVVVTSMDALKFLEQTDLTWDVIIIDLPDPNDESVGKLYTRSFYRLAFKKLAPGGVLVTQATSPYYAADAFWCIYNTLADTTLTSEGGAIYPLAYRTNVPSFGEWGFVAAATRPLSAADIQLDVPTRYLDRELLPTLFVFPKDLAWRQTPIQRIDDQVLVRLYRQGYKRFNQ